MRGMVLVTLFWAAATSSDTGGTSHDLLIGSIVTSLVTLTLGLIGVFATRRIPRILPPSVPPVPIITEDPRDETIKDLRRDIIRLNRRLETEAVRRRELYTEIDRLKDLCRDNDIDWREHA